MQIDFDAVARAALAQSKTLLPEWFPNGRWANREYLIGNLNGDPGESLSINSHSGAWADFSSDARGGDTGQQRDHGQHQPHRGAPNAGGRGHTFSVWSAGLFA